LEEVSGVAKHKVDTTERVDSPNGDDNHCSTEVSSSETIQIANGLRRFFFHADCFLDLNEPVINASASLESFERPFGLSMPASLNVPIGGFGAEPHSTEKNRREKPLESKGDSVRKIICPCAECLDEAVSEELADDNKQINHGNGDSPQHDRASFRAVGTSRDEEHAERDTVNQLSGEEHSRSKCKELQEDGAAGDDAGDSQTHLSACVGRDRTTEQTSYHSTNCRNHVEGCLPSSWKDRRAVRLSVSKHGAELWSGKKASTDLHVVSPEDSGETEEQTV
jgi:hypothetical protein